MRISKIIHSLVVIVLLLFALQTIIIVIVVSNRAQQEERESSKKGELSRIIIATILMDEQSLEIIESQQPFLDYAYITPVDKNVLKELSGLSRAIIFEKYIREEVSKRLKILRTEGKYSQDNPDIEIFWKTEPGQTPYAPMVLKDIITLIRTTDGQKSYALRIKASSVLGQWLPRIIIFYILSSLFIAVLSFWIFRATTKPFLALQKASEEIAKDGKFSPILLSGEGRIKSAFDAFNSMQRRVQLLLDERRKMIAALSHDLKTILTRFSLRMDYIEQEEQRNKAFDDIAYMNRYLDQMVMYAKSGDELKPENKLIDIPLLLKEVTHPFQSEKFLLVFKDLPDNLEVKSDPVFLERIVQNIVSNASRFADRMEIYASLDQESKRVVLTFADNGCGMSEQERGAVFTPYYSTNSARSKNKAGTGLGFMIIHNFTTLLGGGIELLQNSPTGLVVKIYLPAQDVPTEEMHKKSLL